MATDAEFQQILSEAQTAFIRHMGEDLGLRIEATNILAVQILNMTRLAVTSDRTETFEEQFQKVRKEVAARHPENESTVDWAIEVIRRDAFVRGREPDKA